MNYLPVTGTFLDEITYDIPSQNWGRQEWEREFDTYQAIGLDTVVLIRAGLGARLACPSKTLSARVPTLPVYVDLVDMFLELAAERSIDFYFGLYDSNQFWYRYDWKTEVDINREFIKEVWDTYGASPAFRGWYLPHETPDTSVRILDINVALGEEIRRISDLPILISPYYAGRPDIYGSQHALGMPRTAEENGRIWEEIFARYSGLINYCAFQDATTDLLKLADFTAVIADLAGANGIRLWSNLETFDRDMPIKFPPTDWRKLAHRLDSVQSYVEKIITFEFAHFMSPNSMWPSARNLFDRYQEHVRKNQA